MGGIIQLEDRREFKERMKQLLTVNPAKTAVVTIDLQNNYLEPDGGKPLLPEEAERVIKGHKELLSFARAEGIPVVHAYVVRRPEEIERGFVGDVRYLDVGVKHQLSQSPHTSWKPLPDRPAGSRRAQVPEELVAPTDFHVTTKRTLDSFMGSELETLLTRALKVDTLVLTGINTDTCVYATTFGATCRGFYPIVISDCVASMRGKDAHQMALELMSRSIAWVLTVEEFKQKVREFKEKQGAEAVAAAAQR